MVFQVVQGFQTYWLQKGKSQFFPFCANGKKLHISSDTYLIIKLLHSRVLRLIARSILLVLFLAILFTFRNMVGAPFFSAPTQSDSDSIDDAKMLSSVFHDLANEGLIKTGDRAVLLSSGYGNGDSIPQVLMDYDMDLISITDLDKQNIVADGSVDFVFTYASSTAQQFVDRTLKAGGIAVVQLSSDAFLPSIKPSQYKTVYVRRFDSTILAMRKTGYSESKLGTHRSLLGCDTEIKKAALKNLEDVLLEPPRAASGKSNSYLKRTKYLPDLMGDSLESYPRRVFIDVGLPSREGGSGTEWFTKNYPTRNLDFKMYKIESVTEESYGKEVAQQVEEIGMSDWLQKNVKVEEFVVMKAEAEAVEEMMKTKAITLVDELFLECKPKAHGRKGRAYWECLSLYGRLRDEGVAVHQWWG